MIGKVGGGKKTQATTDAEGRFVFPAVEAGRYVLAAELPGFRALQQDRRTAPALRLDPVVTLQIGAVQETISVKGRRGSGAARGRSGASACRRQYPAAAQDQGRQADLPGVDAGGRS